MMKHTPTILKVALALCVAFLLLALTLLAKPEQAQPAAVETGGGMALHPPAFLKSARAQDAAQVDFSFIVEEAGMAAYTKLDQELDLANMEGGLMTVGRHTDQFISGIVIAPGYEKLPEFSENAEIQVFLHRDGWIVAYLTKYQTAAALFDWVNYDNKRLTGTLIENTVRKLAEDASGASDINVTYYDFRNPQATNLMLVSDRVDNIKHAESFVVNIPRELTVDESSWSYSQFGMATDCNTCRYPGFCALNDNAEKLIAYDTGDEKWQLAIGELSKVKFALGKDHKFNVTGQTKWTGVWIRAYCGVAIVYREAAK